LICAEIHKQQGFVLKKGAVLYRPFFM
jgi:hypothetical protein